MKVSPGKIKVKDMSTLRQEKLRLKQLCGEMEKEMDSRFDYLKGNYKSMAFNSFFPGSQKRGSVVKWATGLAKMAWKAEKIQPLFGGALLNIVEVVAARYGLKYFGSFLGKILKKKRK